MFSLFKKRKNEKNLETLISEISDHNENLANLISPDSIEEKQQYIRMGSNYIRVLAVVSYSADSVYANFLEKLHMEGENISIIHHIDPISPEDMIGALDRAILECNSRLLEAQRPQVVARIKKELSDNEILLDRLVNGNTRAFLQHMYVLLQGSSVEELDRMERKVKTLVSRHLKLLAPHQRMMDAFHSCLPIVENKLPEYTYRDMDAEALSSLFPFEESEIYSDSGIVIGKNIKTNGLVIVDYTKFLNRNESVVGCTGSGKSTYLFSNMIRRWIQGFKIRVICPKGEFGSKVKKLGGEWIKLSPMGGSIINPLEISKTTIPKDEDGQPLEASLLHQKINRLKTFFTLMFSQLDQVHLSLLEQLLIQLYRNHDIHWNTDFSRKNSEDFPILKDLYDEIEKRLKSTDESDHKYRSLTEFQQVLYTYVHGSFSRVFNGKTDVDLSNDFLCVDLYALKDEPQGQRVAYYNVLTFLRDDAFSNLDKVHIYVDEGHVLANPNAPEAMRFLNDIYKTIRSFNGGVTTATQEIKDFLSAKEGSKNYGEAIISQSMFKMYLPVLAGEMENILDNTKESFSEEEKRILVVKEGEIERNAGKGIYCVGSQKAHVDIDLSPEEWEIWKPDMVK